MKIKTLKSIRTLLKSSAKRSCLPILDCFFIDQEYLFFTDLEVQVKVKHLFPVEKDSQRIVVNSGHFLQRMENIKAPYFIYSGNSKVIFKQPESLSTMKNEEANDFPERIDNKDPQFIFNLTAREIGFMDIASQFVADDQLRPVMQTVCVGAHFIVSSDAHMLYYRKIEVNENIEVLFDKKVIKLMMLFPGMSFKISKTGKYLCAEGEEVTIWWRSEVNNYITLNIDSPAKKTGYPNWRSVLPTIEHTAIIPLKETIAALDAIKFAVNGATGQVRLNLKANKLEIKAKDLDFELSASEVVDVVNSDNNDIEFGMKIQFLRRVLKCLQDEGYAQVEMGYCNPSRAFIFGNQILIMPMMINE